MYHIFPRQTLFCLDYQGIIPASFWTESPSFPSHQNLRPRRLKYTCFEHRRILFPFFGHHLIFFGNPVEVCHSLMLLPVQISILNGRNDDQPSMQHLAPIFPIYSVIPRVPHDFFYVFTHPFCDVATAWCHIVV